MPDHASDHDHALPDGADVGLRPSPAPPVLDAACRDEVARAARTVHTVLDELGPWLRDRAGAVAPTIKSDGTPVTNADVEASDRLAAAVGAHHPGHAVLSEEADTTHVGAEWTWVVDPVDGTSNFVAGIPWWSVSVALLWQGRPVLGVVDAPPLRTRVEAIAGGGTRRDGAGVRVGPAVALDGSARHAPILVTSGAIRRATSPVPLKARVMGSAALDLAMVAAGVVVATVSMRPKAWDVAAGALLVQEAGGAVATLDGGSHFPLEAGTDYAVRSRPTLSGPSVEWLERVVRTVAFRRSGPT